MRLHHGVRIHNIALITNYGLHQGSIQKGPQCMHTLTPRTQRYATIRRHPW